MNIYETFFKKIKYVYTITKGIALTEYWKKKELNLSHEWDTTSYESMEVERVEYLEKLEKYRLKIGVNDAEFPVYSTYFKYFVAALITLVFVSL